MDSAGLQIIKLVLSSPSFMLLTEFGRRGVRAAGWRVPGPWLVVALCLLCMFGALADGVHGLSVGLYYTLGLPGSLSSLTFWLWSNRYEQANAWDCGWRR
ncbi:MAG TPA: hypothetical protein VGL77_06795 [Armatimonadota bacterium]